MIYIFFSTFLAVFDTASPVLETSLPKPLTVLQPVRTKIEAMLAIRSFFMRVPFGNKMKFENCARLRVKLAIYWLFKSLPTTMVVYFSV